MFTTLSTLAVAASLAVFPPQEVPTVVERPGAEESARTPAATELPAEFAFQEPAVTGLPQRAPEPRTMQAYWPVFALLSLTWLGFTAYMLRFAKRSARVAALAAGEGDR